MRLTREGKYIFEAKTKDKYIFEAQDKKMGKDAPRASKAHKFRKIKKNEERQTVGAHKFRINEIANVPSPPDIGALKMFDFRKKTL